MGLIGAALLVLVDLDYSWPYWLSVVLALVVGTLFGVLIELSVIRRLFTAPRVIVLVATIGVAQLSLAIISAYPEVDNASSRYPVALGREWEIAGVRVTGPQVSMLVVAPLVAIGLAWFLNRTLLGKVVRASADNADLSRLSGVNPKLVSTAMWGLAGFLSTLSMVLIAGNNRSALALASLGPSTLVRAMAAAALASFVSVPRALIAGVAIGVAQNVVQFNFLDEPGLIDFLLLLAVLAAVASQSRHGDRDVGSFRFAPRVRPLPESLGGVWWLRHLDRLAFAALVAGAVAIPFTTTAGSRHLIYAVVAAFAVCALSVIVLTGWAGQLSLGQMAFAGVGALTAAALTRGVTADIGWRDNRILKGELPALPFALSSLIGALVAAALATLVGLGALEGTRSSPRRQHVCVRGRGRELSLRTTDLHRRRNPGSVPPWLAARPRPGVSSFLLPGHARHPRGGDRHRDPPPTYWCGSRHHRGAGQPRCRRVRHRSRGENQAPGLRVRRVPGGARGHAARRRHRAGLDP